MNSWVKLDDCRKEIRSLLLPFQKGCSLSQFHRTYQDLIGKRLPAREFGFKTDIEFLLSMPDVVKITFAESGEYYLQGIADEKTKHIKNMVSKQKEAQSELPTQFGRSRSFVPQFRKHLRVPESTFSEKAFPKEPTYFEKSLPKEPKLPLSKPSKNSTQLSKILSPLDEVILLIQTCGNKLALDDLLVQYSRIYNKNLSLAMYGFSSVAECIKFIPELDIVQKNNVDFIVYLNSSEATSSYSSRTTVPADLNSSYVRNKTTRISTQVPSTFNSNVIRKQRSRILTPEVPPEIYSDCIRSKTSKRPPTSNSSCFMENQTLRTHTLKVPSEFNSNFIRNQSCYERSVPNSLKKKLQRVADRFPEDIYAADFPDYFEEETSECLDFHSLGYRCLRDFLSDVPDIFILKPVIGSEKDFIVHPAKPKFNDSMHRDRIALKIKNILEAYPEGIKIKDILHVYSIYCKDNLYVKDLGFDDLEAFLSSIKTSIPLKFGVINGEKSVHLNLNFNPVNSIMEPEPLEKGAVPFDAVTEECTFKPLPLPVDFDCTKFIPVHVSAVAHPGKVYIQFSGKPIQSFVELSKIMDTLYDGMQSELYMMKSGHIKEGASCVAKWPTDNHWYRVHILSIPSMETVKVNYIDYGASEIIPINLLRYLKKEYVDLPVQSLRCRLSYIKPPRNAENWDPEVKDRILKLCFDVPLMAKFEKGSDGIYSIVLCDTNGASDVYINDVLCDEGLAEYDVVGANNNNPEPKLQLEYFPNFNTLQALQAQYFLKAFAAVAPPFVQNEHYKMLFRQVSMYCQATDPEQQNIGM